MTCCGSPPTPGSGRRTTSASAACGPTNITQQRISGRLTSEDATQDRLDIRSYIETARKPQDRDLYIREHDYNNQISSFRAPAERAIADLKPGGFSSPITEGPLSPILVLGCHWLVLLQTGFRISLRERLKRHDLTCDEWAWLEPLLQINLTRGGIIPIT